MLLRSSGLSLALLAACSSLAPPPDATPEPTCSIATWRDAYVVFEDARCLATERCFPDAFHANYADIAACVTVWTTTYHCIGAGAWCDSAFPAERCDALARCHADEAVLSCDATDAPPSCYEALR